MIYLTNTLPNSFLGAFSKSTLRVLSENEVLELVCTADYYQDYDDAIAPVQLKPGVVSVIGHVSVAETVAALLSRANGATLGGHLCRVDVPVNREQVSLTPSDQVVACLVAPPRRLAEGEVWAEEELASMPVQWVLFESD